MFCEKCGTKNRKDAKVCKNCGEALVKEVKDASYISNPGGIRKQMKKDAREKVNGTLIGATAVYLVILIFVSAIFSGSFGGDSTATFISQIITSLISIVFGFGLFIVGFKAIKGEKFEFGDIFIKPFNRAKFLGYIILLTVIVMAISFVAGLLMIIPLLGFFVMIAFIVALIYYTPAIEAFMLILADPKTKEDISFDDTIRKALEITKGNRVEYYGITFSFIGWCLLSLLTFGILFIWVIPYMQLTYVNMYRKWTKEEDFNTEETGLSNGAVIGFTAGGCGCGCLIALVFLVSIIATIITTFGLNTNNPDINGFIEKFVPEADRAGIEADLNKALDEFQAEYNR